MYPGDKNSYFGIFIKHQIEDLKNEGIEIIKVVKTRKTSFAYIPFILKSIFYLLFSSYDLVHAHYGFHSALFAAIVKRRPLIITFHGTDALKEPLRNNLYYELQRFVISRSDHTIAVSNEIKNVLTSNLGADPNKMSIINCGVNTSIFRPLNKANVRKKLGISEDAKVVLFAGSLSYPKGIDLIFKCAWHMSDVTFILVGDGALKTDFKNCKFAGARPHSEMPMWMNAADIFALPSRSEGTPVAVLEALSCGIPVIASEVGGNSDVIKDGQTGYLVPVNNLDIFQRKVRDLLNNEAARHIMGRQGKRDAIEKFDSRKVAKRIKKIYQEAMNSRGSILGVSSKEKAMKVTKGEVN